MHWVTTSVFERALEVSTVIEVLVGMLDVDFLEMFCSRPLSVWGLRAVLERSNSDLRLLVFESETRDCS